MTDEEIIKHYINKNDLIKDDCKDEFYEIVKKQAEKRNISLYESLALVTFIAFSIKKEVVKWHERWHYRNNNER